jgi:hypothetical protein
MDVNLFHNQKCTDRIIGIMNFILYYDVFILITLLIRSSFSFNINPLDCISNNLLTSSRWSLGVVGLNNMISNNKEYLTLFLIDII